MKYFYEKKGLGPNIYVDTRKYVIMAVRGTIAFNEILRSGINILRQNAPKCSHNL